MLFNSYEYIFVFLPAAFIIYFLFNSRGHFNAAKIWLIIASLLFYSWWSIYYLPLIIFSICVNYLAGIGLNRPTLPFPRQSLLIGGLIFNIGLLGYFKYADFFIANINLLIQADIPLLHLTLPLAISFYTFQQIAYLVDNYRGQSRENNFLNYALFVLFFPQLIAGPIVHHREMIWQYEAPENKKIDFKNIATGLFIFFIGLFKKVVIADTFAVWAAYGFDTAPALSLIEGWVVSLSYTFQLYFDFSGYTDMAIGAALLFNFRLPVNFFSPYRALSIQDFWRRWHMTLGRFLRQYIYIPLGGSRVGEVRLYTNIMITFLIGGLWHGAGWTFVFWGFLHGAALVVNRWWQKQGLQMNNILAWFLTFNFVNVAWVFFRAASWADAVKVLKAMFGFSGVIFPESTAPWLGFLSKYHISFGGFVMEDFIYSAVIMCAAFLLIVIWLPNSMQLQKRFQPNIWTAVITGTIGLTAILMLTNVSEFLYFNF
ncbi:MAG TPA: MBOAT family O-acyltransferase [Syntrophomonadaceae bacterium]|nr:MBOAT family O-acyltransferase [Syntrophomonadaceae bacterium]